MVFDFGLAEEADTEICPQIQVGIVEAKSRADEGLSNKSNPLGAILRMVNGSMFLCKTKQFETFGLYL